MKPLGVDILFKLYVEENLECKFILRIFPEGFVFECAGFPERGTAIFMPETYEKILRNRLEPVKARIHTSKVGEEALERKDVGEYVFTYLIPVLHGIVKHRLDSEMTGGYYKWEGPLPEEVNAPVYIRHGNNVFTWRGAEHMCGIEKNKNVLLATFEVSKDGKFCEYIKDIIPYRPY